MKSVKKFGIYLLLAALLCGCRRNEMPSETTVPMPSLPTSQVVENTTAPATEPATQQTAPAVTEPSTEPPRETVAETRPTVAPTTEPVTQPPRTEPATEPTEPPVEEPAIPLKTTVEASGILVKEGDDAVIDYSNTADGYVMACYTGQTDKKLKAQVKGPTTTYTYNLTPGNWAAFPLSDENGEYKITIYRNTTGTKYATVLSLTVTVAMTDEFAPFLRANQYVDFDAAPKTVAKAAALTAGLTDPLKKVEAVYHFVVNTLTYDKELAANVKSGYLPELDQVLEKEKGICFDYAALMTGMLRSQNVPTKLVVGYAGEAYHAWISVWAESIGWIDGVIYFDGVSWHRMDPTFASSGQNSWDILQYIGDGNNYTAKYFY